MVSRVEIRLECRASADLPWRVLNRDEYTLGDTSTEKDNRARTEARIAAAREGWQRRYEPFSAYEFRIVRSEL